MQKAKIFIEKNFKIAVVDKRIFASFLEHLGRAIYSGIYEPNHPSADENGFRTDSLNLINELGVSLIRYPGGNFVSGYNWTDGIGPKENRPKRLDYAWKTIESNQFGIDEFVKWSKKAKTDVMAAVNMGTGTPQEAGYMLEYCNFPKDTYWSDLRIKNGSKDPHDIKLWCVGNEMDGPWQTGHLNAHEYGRKASEAGKIMKWVDPSIELVMCGSSSSQMPTYPSYDRIVLEESYDEMDYLSLHMYFQDTGVKADFLASFLKMDDFIKTITSTCDYVKAVKRSKKNINLSFDEWNVWYNNNPEFGKDFNDIDKDMENEVTLFGYHKKAPHILENNYSMLDALCFSGLMLSLLNNADRVKIACLAQLVNAIAPIMTKEGGLAIKQTIFYPFRDISKYSVGNVLKAVANVPTIETANGEAPIIYTSIIDNEDAKEIAVFALNISENDCLLELDMRSFNKVSMIEHTIMCDSDLNASNTFKHPERISPKNTEITVGEFSEIELNIKGLSWNVIRFKY